VRSIADRQTRDFIAVTDDQTKQLVSRLSGTGEKGSSDD
jgi:hypothetical protein